MCYVAALFLAAGQYGSRQLPARAQHLALAHGHWELPGILVHDTGEIRMYNVKYENNTHRWVNYLIPICVHYYCTSCLPVVAWQITWRSRHDKRHRTHSAPRYLGGVHMAFGHTTVLPASRRLAIILATLCLVPRATAGAPISNRVRPTPCYLGGARSAVGYSTAVFRGGRGGGASPHDHGGFLAPCSSSSCPGCLRE